MNNTRNKILTSIDVHYTDRHYATMTIHVSNDLKHPVSSTRPMDEILYTLYRISTEVSHYEMRYYGEEGNVYWSTQRDLVVRKVIENYCYMQLPIAAAIRETEVFKTDGTVVRYSPPENCREWRQTISALANIRNDVEYCTILWENGDWEEDLSWEDFIELMSRYYFTKEIRQG